MNEQIDIHELCLDGDYSKLKSVIESEPNVDVNHYKLVVYRSTSHKFKEKGNLLNSDSDDEDQYENDLFYFDYRSPLFSSIVNNHLSCVKLLVGHGADLHRLRPWGLNAFSLSAYCSSRRLIEYLIENNFNPNETDRPNSTDQYFQSLPVDHPHKTQMKQMHSRVAQDMGMFHYPLHILIKNDSVDLVQLVLDRCPNIEININEGYTKRTGLHLAAERSSIEILRLLFKRPDLEINPFDFNNHTPLDLLWKTINNLDYQFEYREETLKLMLYNRCRFSSIRSLTELNLSSFSAFRRFESNFWILVSFDLKSLFVEKLENTKVLLVNVWLWFNRNYQDTLIDDHLFDRKYTGSILRNLIHLMYENEQIRLTNRELVELFTEDLGSHFDKTTDEIDTITTILSRPLKLKHIARNRIRQSLCQSSTFYLNRSSLSDVSFTPLVDERLRSFILP